MSGLTKDDLARFNRQMILPGFGREGQERLKTGRVLIVGMGGLGSPASMYLAAAGVGTLGLADFDNVDLSNLHRQILHNTSRVGMPKVASAVETLSGIHPATQLIPYRNGIHSEDLPGLFADYDVIVDCSDNFPTRYMVNDAAVLAQKPLVYGSIFQYEGQASFFHPANGAPCYRCLFPEMPDPASVPNCSQGGVIGAVCGMIGSIQAMEAIKFLTGVGETLSGRLLVIDSATMSVRTLKIKRDADCPVCSSHPSIKSIVPSSYIWNCAAPSPEGAREMEAEVLAQQLSSETPPFLLDVREPDECVAGMIAGAVNIPLGDLGPRLSELPKDRSIVTICYSGMRSGRAAEMLVSKGFTKVTNLKGGVRAWARQVDPSFPV